MWISSETEGKISVFKNYPDTCGRGPENPAPLPAPLQALILDISQPIHTRAIKFALVFFYFTFDDVNARKGDGTLLVVSRSYVVIKYKPTFV